MPARGLVEWGTSSRLGSQTTGPVTADHAIVINGLDPDRYYYYRVLLDGRPVSSVKRTHTFGKPGCVHLSFFVFGDSGTGGPTQYRVADLLNRWTFDLGLVPGDVIYQSGQRENFDPNFFAPYRDILTRTPFFPVFGNHDVETENGAPYLEAFHLPTANSGSERYYSFDVGSVHFVCLDSTDVDLDPQVAWLRRDLQAARTRGARWIFAQCHHPLYSSGFLNGPDYRVRAAFGPIFEEFEVDIVFTGHEHNYERSVPVQQYEPGKRGVVYYVVGTGGYPLLYDLGPLKPYSAANILRHGFLKVEVREDLLYAEFVDASTENFGGVLDAYTIRRGAVRPALRATGEYPTPGGTFPFELTAPAGTIYAVFVATQPGYLPTPIGIYQLLLGSEALFTDGTMAGEALPLRARIPQDASLQGADLLLQAITQRGTAAPEFTDLLASVIR